MNIRDIQHFLYCSHRWGLINIGNVWAENFYVIKANLLHKNVHNSDKPTYSKNKKILNAVAVYNDDYDLYGVCDCLELKKSKQGAKINDETYEIAIVEHKPTKPKGADYNFDDAMQVFAQKLCVDYVFKTNSTAYLYYADVKKRILLPFDEQFEKFNNQLTNILSEMNEYYESDTIPQIKKAQKCSGCSLKDVCMPKIKLPKNIKSEIYKSLESEA